MLGLLNTADSNNSEASEPHRIAHHSGSRDETSEVGMARLGHESDDKGDDESWDKESNADASDAGGPGRETPDTELRYHRDMDEGEMSDDEVGVAEGEVEGDAEEMEEEDPGERREDEGEDEGEGDEGEMSDDEVSSGEEGDREEMEEEDLGERREDEGEEDEGEMSDDEVGSGEEGEAQDDSRVKGAPGDQVDATLEQVRGFCVFKDYLW